MFRLAASPPENLMEFSPAQPTTRRSVSPPPIILSLFYSVTLSLIIPSFCLSFICPSVGRLVCRNFLKERKLYFHASWRNCFSVYHSASLYVILLFCNSVFYVGNFWLYVTLSFSHSFSFSVTHSFSIAMSHLVTLLFHHSVSHFLTLSHP